MWYRKRMPGPGPQSFMWGDVAGTPAAESNTAYRTSTTVVRSGKREGGTQRPHDQGTDLRAPFLQICADRIKLVRIFGCDACGAVCGVLQSATLLHVRMREEGYRCRRNQNGLLAAHFPLSDGPTLHLAIRCSSQIPLFPVWRHRNDMSIRRTDCAIRIHLARSLASKYMSPFAASAGLMCSM